MLSPTTQPLLLEPYILRGHWFSLCALQVTVPPKPQHSQGRAFVIRCGRCNALLRVQGTAPQQQQQQQQEPQPLLLGQPLNYSSARPLGLEKDQVSQSASSSFRDGSAP